MDLLVGESKGVRCELRLFIRQKDGSLKGMGPVQVDGEDIYYYERAKARYVDLNGDGLKDLIAIENNEELVRVFHNIGTETEPKFKDFYYLEVGGKILDGYSGCVDFGDLNGDGLLDLVYSKGFKGNDHDLTYFKYALNVGTLKSPKYSELKVFNDQDGNPYTIWDNMYALFFSLHDWNKDKKLDLVTSRANKGILILENVTIGTKISSPNKMNNGFLKGINIHFKNNKIILDKAIEKNTKMEIYTINGKQLLSKELEINQRVVSFEYSAAQKLIIVLQNNSEKVIRFIESVQ